MSRFPVAGVLGVAIAALGGYLVYWYENLTLSEQEKVNRLAQHYAYELYSCAVSELTNYQLEQVCDAVRGRLA